jgi:DNA-binding NarL/FixJ family response regulator
MQDKEVRQVSPIRVLIADDHTLVREGIRALIERLPDIEVVAEATDGRDALNLLRTCRPDVVLMDISMPRLNGLDATRLMIRTLPNIRVIILSMHRSEQYVWQALDAGAAGYLLKDTDLTEVSIAINAVMRGKAYLSPEIAMHVIKKYVRRGDSNESFRLALTPRQREVLQLMAEGTSTRKIAETLNISVKTVETHRAQLMERLDIHDVAGLVRYAMRTGLVQQDD